MATAAQIIKSSPLGSAALRLRYSRLGNVAFALPGRLRLRQARRGTRRLAFEIDGKMGMGAMLTHLVLVLGLCERLRIAPVVRFTNPLYSRTGKGDWFPDFFEQIDAEPQPDDDRLPRVRIRNDVDHAVLGSPRDLTLRQGHDLFTRHIRFKPFPVDEADALFREHMAGRTPLGVHYRGTDKHCEAPLVERARAIAAVTRQLERGRHGAIFLATDEPDFAAELKAALPGFPVVSYERPELKASPGQPIHFSGADGYWKGVDALVNILLLARCDTVIRTASFLSGWAKVLNPSQKIRMLNRAFSDTRFPDNQIQSDLE